jgi:hypothetical protein
VLNVYALMLSQVSIVSFTRRLEVISGDIDLDQAIVPGDMSVLWSFNTLTSNTQHGFGHRGESL